LFFSLSFLGPLPFLFPCHSRACCRSSPLSFSGVLPSGNLTRESNKKIVMPETPHNVIASDSAAISAESNKPRSPRRSLSLPPRDDIIIFRGDIVFFRTTLIRHSRIVPLTTTH
jgi:hypothetical protein